ncbi:MAG: hypothetical protein LC713_02370 [Actinobacteria bacterium]|nr:hypothetical protein [Actinomycetota bacterium]
MSESDQRRDLVQRIETRRAGVGAYLRQQRPRTRRLANATIVLSSLAAIFTAGPAAGGENFSGGVQRAFGLNSDSYVWRALCLAALLVSVGAALLTNVGRSQEAVTRLSTAEAVSAELEGLATLVQFGHLPLEDAVKLYQDYTVKIPFVEDAPALAPR